MLLPLSRFIFGRRRFFRFNFRLILLFPIALLMFKMSVLIFEGLKNEPYVTKHEQTDALKVNLAQPRNVYGEKQRLLDGDVKKRQNLIIVAHGRSGSTFIGNIFNHHPNVFYLFEPYQTVERLHGEVAPENSEYQAKAFQWMKGALNCDFVSPQHVKDLETYYRKKYSASYNPLKSISLLSPPFCPYNATDPLWKAENCPQLDQTTVERTCKAKYSVTVMKALMARMPEKSVKQLIELCNTNQFDCKIIFLVRDPRGIIPSSRAVKFYKDKDAFLDGTRKFSQDICNTTEANLNIIRSLPEEVKKRLMLLRYEDLAKDPLKALPGLLKFAGLPMDESLTKWLDLASHFPESKSERAAATWRQDSWEGAQRWRWKVGSDVIDIIENHCSHVMNLLGYKAVNGSSKIQKDLDVGLLEDKYDALKWFVDAH